MKRRYIYIILLAINLLYASVSIASRWAAAHPFASWPYLGGLVAVGSVLTLYALAWQWVLTKVPMATAYMFKGSSLVFVLVLSTLLFDEGVTVGNIAGAALIISGIAMAARC
ncbi:MAG: EamA family transporter [Bacteroidales bacterium]|nr:EamA family transporter [Bacteroidales bacterium]